MSTGRKAIPLHKPRRRPSRRRPRRGPSRRSAPRTNQHLPSAITHGSLEDGMTICLSLLERDPDRFEAAAVAWYARWCSQLGGVPFDDSESALLALQALSGAESAAAARTLSGICRRYELDKVAVVLDSWLEGASGPVATLPAQPPPEGPSAA